jgi:hypothetical protein
MRHDPALTVDEAVKLLVIDQVEHANDNVILRK